VPRRRGTVAIIRRKERAMRTHLLRNLAAGAGLVLIASAAQAQQGIRWEKSFDSALAAARKSNKLVMADFYTDW
jgi:thiol:disulfide interchange protein